MSNGNYREVGDEYREEEARRRYRISHPLIERVKINPLDAVLELSLAYFEANPEATQFQIHKTELGKAWNKSINIRNEMIGELVSENAFITDSRKGFLIIDRKGLEEFQELRYLDLKEEAMNDRYEILTNQVKEKEMELKPFEDKIAEMEKSLKEKQDRIGEQANRLKELEGQNQKLIEEVKGLSSNLIEAKGKKESLEKVKNKGFNELKEVEDSNRQIMADIAENSNLIRNSKDLTHEQLLSKEISKLKGELYKKNQKIQDLDSRLREEHYTRNRIILGIIIGLIILDVWYLWHGIFS